MHVWDCLRFSEMNKSNEEVIFLFQWTQTQDNFCKSIYYSERLCSFLFCLVVCKEKPHPKNKKYKNRLHFINSNMFWMFNLSLTLKTIFFEQMSVCEKQNHIFCIHRTVPQPLFEKKARGNGKKFVIQMKYLLQPYKKSCSILDRQPFDKCGEKTEKNATICIHLNLYIIFFMVSFIQKWWFTKPHM